VIGTPTCADNAFPGVNIKRPIKFNVVLENSAIGSKYYNIIGIPEINYW